MTNNEAIEYLKGQIKCLKCETGIDCKKCIMPNWSKEIEIEALNKGIEAIENQKTGHWIDYGAKYDVRCSICNTQYPLKPISGSRLMGCKSNYCPGCGAKMQEVEE